MRVLRFLLLLLLLPFAAAAQCTINTPPCAAPFVAVDVASGQLVQALCVGRAVRFDLGCGRTVAANLLYYNALPTPSAGTFTTPAGCNFVPGQLAGNTYTPTTAGTVTVSELANPAVAGGAGTVFVRNFPVFAAPPPGFSLLPCPGGNVQILIIGGGYDQYFVQVNGGAATGPVAPNVPTTLAAAAGSTVTVVGSYLTNGLCSNSSSQTVAALAPATTPVLVRLTTQSLLPGTLLLDVASLPAGYVYDVQRDAGGGAWQRVALVPAGSATATLPGAPAGLYRLGRRDVCRLDSAFSAPAPTLELSGTSLNNVNALSWQAAGPVAGYTLLRDGTVLATLPATATTYADAAVSCGTTYAYRLQASTAGGVAVVSNAAAVRTVSTLAPPAPIVNASFGLTNQVVLTAYQAGGMVLGAGETVAYTRQAGGRTRALGTVPTGAATADTLRDPAPFDSLRAAPPCYVARLVGACGTASAAGPPTCPALLLAAPADPEGLTAQLTWTAFTGPAGTGATYRVLTLDAAGRVLAASAPTTALTYLDLSPPLANQVLRYRVEASGAGLPPGTVSYSNVAQVVRRPRLVVPNAFTPNGDGLNDVLELKGRYLNAFSFIVVDRNGQQVFRATDRSQTWDGTIQGHAPVNAAYVWRFSMLDETGEPFGQVGTVTIVK